MSFIDDDIFFGKTNTRYFSVDSSSSDAIYGDISISVDSIIAAQEDGKREVYSKYNVLMSIVKDSLTIGALDFLGEDTTELINQLLKEWEVDSGKSLDEVLFKKND